MYEEGSVDQSVHGRADEAEQLARAFLAALDEGRWSDAADLVDPQTREAFQTWCVERIRTASDAGPSAPPLDTHFLSIATLMGVATPAEAADFTSTQFVARFAEALSPGGLHRQRGAPGPSPQSRITREFIETVFGAHGRATALYRTEWWDGNQRNRSMGGTHSLELVLTQGGWRVRDADLAGWGGGRILPPPD
jgi:hypothetical protein